MTLLPRLAVFDVDGTLIDSQHTIVSAMLTAFAAHGLPAPRPEAVRRIIGLSLVEAVRCLLPEEAAAQPETALAVAHAYKEAFVALREKCGHDPLFPGARATLDRLEAEGWLLGLATGKSRRGVEAMIERHGFAGRFVTVQTADGHPSKPDPSMVLQALRETGVAAEVCVMVGDTAYDMAMARAARVRAVGVCWGYHPPEELELAGAERLAEDFAALPALLAAIIGEAACARL